MTALRGTARAWLMAVVGLTIVAVSLWQIMAASRGLAITSVPSADPPLTIIGPAGAAAGSRPLVLIAHGFAGSALIMRNFAYTLAHAGYVTVSWDADGHGANGHPLGARPLLSNAEGALAEARARGLVVPGRVAIVGHSMGSGVALEFGQAYPETAATIAVSPVGQKVTPALPRNLLLLAGSLEQPFVRNAEARLAEAGGPGGDLGQGTARRLTIIPNVEHITILFVSATQREMVAWLNGTFGPQPGATAYTDWRMAWYGLAVLGTLLVAAALARLVWGAAARPDAHDRSPFWRAVLALAAGAVLATGILGVVSRAGVPLRSLFGLLLGGYLMLWFAIAGLTALLILRPRLGPPSRRALAGGLLAFAAIWLGVGLVGQHVWFPWLLIWPRLRLWPLAAALLLPWFLAAAQTAPAEGTKGQMARWLVQSVVLVAGLLLALRLTPDLGFLLLILPALPILTAIHTLAAAPHRGAWPFALSGALSISWMLLALFPLQ